MNEFVERSKAVRSRQQPTANIDARDGNSDVVPAVDKESLTAVTEALRASSEADSSPKRVALLRSNGSSSSLMSSSSSVISESSELSEAGSFNELPNAPVRVESVSSGAWLLEARQNSSTGNPEPSRRVWGAPVVRGANRTRRGEDGDLSFLMGGSPLGPTHDQDSPQGREDEYEEETIEIDDRITFTKKKQTSRFQRAGAHHVPGPQYMSRQQTDDQAKQKIKEEASRLNTSVTGRSDPITKQTIKDEASRLNASMVGGFSNPGPPLDDVEQQKHLVGAFPVRYDDDDDDEVDEEIVRMITYSMGVRNNRTVSRGARRVDSTSSQSESLDAQTPKGGGGFFCYQHHYICIGIILLFVGLVGTAVGVAVGRSESFEPPSSPTLAPSLSPTAPTPWKEVFVLNSTERGFASTIAFSGGMVAMEKGDGYVVVYNVSSGVKVGRSIPGQRPRLSSDGQSMALKVDNYTVLVYDLEEKDHRWIRRGKTNLNATTVLDIFAMSESSNIVAVIDRLLKAPVYQYGAGLWSFYDSHSKASSGWTKELEELEARIEGLSLVNQRNANYKDVVVAAISYFEPNKDQESTVAVTYSDGRSLGWQGAVDRGGEGLPGGPSVSLSRDGNFLAVGGTNALLYRSQGSLLPKYGNETPSLIEEGKNGELLEVELSSDAKFVAVGSSKHVNVYKMMDWNDSVFASVGGIEKDGGDLIISFSFSRDGRFLAVGEKSASGEAIMRVYDIQPAR